MIRNIISASSTSSTTMIQRSTYNYGEFNIWNLIKRRNMENAFCMTSKFRVNARVRRIKSDIVTRHRRLTEDDQDNDDQDDSSSSSSGLSQDFEVFDEEDDDLYELYDMLSEQANIKDAASVIITQSKQFSRDRPSSGGCNKNLLNFFLSVSAQSRSPEPVIVNTLECYMIDEIASKGSRAQKLYIKKCAEFQLTPSKTFLKALNSSVVDIGHQNIGPKGAEACAIALSQTSTVSVLNMNDNSIGHKGAKFIAILLKGNRTITELNLADNNIGVRGAKYLTYVISEHDRIRHLDLSNNGFKEKDADIFKQMLEETRNLHYLNLSHNEFREVGGEILGEGIGYNEGLEELDLSWNHLRRSGAVGIAQALLDNSSLRRLNLAWNGFYLEGCIELQRTLVYNQTLEVLDLTNNRINRECIDQLARGLAHNTSIHTLILKFNPLTQEGAHDILQFINECPTSGITTLDLGIQQVDAGFINLINEIHIKGRTIEVIYGHVIGQRPSSRPNMEESLIKEHPALVLLEFGKLLGFRLMDLFCSLDKDGTRTLDKDEITVGLKMANVPISDNCIEALIKKMDINGDGEIDFSELLVAQQEHRLKVMELLAAERGEGEVKVEDTTIWKIRTMLQKLLAEKMSDYASFRIMADKLARRIQKASDELETKREAITRARATKPRKIRSIPTSPSTYKSDSRSDSLARSPTPLDIEMDTSNILDGTLHDSITRLDLDKIRKILNDEHEEPKRIRRKMSIQLPISDQDRILDTRMSFKRNLSGSETSNSTAVVEDVFENLTPEIEIRECNAEQGPVDQSLEQNVEEVITPLALINEKGRERRSAPHKSKRKSKVQRINIKVNTLFEETPEMDTASMPPTPTPSKTSRMNTHGQTKVKSKSTSGHDRKSSVAHTPRQRSNLLHDEPIDIETIDSV